MADALQTARALVARYLDPARAWSGADDRRLRALLGASPEAAQFYNRTVARHRAMLGQSPAVPSGFELARMAKAATDLAAAPRRARWLAWLVPAVAAAAAVVLALPLARSSDPTASTDDYIGARGLPASGLPERHAGLGVGGVTADGLEYEAIYSHEVFLDDWLRVSFTNERPELAHLFVFALQPERPTGQQIVWIAPSVEEGRSLPIGIARLRSLPFEVRLGARHAEGPVRFVALFTAAPLTIDRVLEAVDPLSSDLEASLRARLQLSPRDVVQVLETRVVPGSAESGLPPAPRQEVPRP